MAKMLKDALKTIEKYKSITPHYGEMLDILGEILILREEYRRKMKNVIFPIDEGLMEKKIFGGLPLIDFSTGPLTSRNLSSTSVRSWKLRKSGLPVKQKRFFR